MNTITENPLVSVTPAEPTIRQPSAEDAAPGAGARVRSLPAAYLELTKPGIVRMVLITAAAGYVMASGSVIDVRTLIHALIGMGLTAAGSCGLNQWLEWRIDATMRRTSSRPIPTGQISPGRALAFSLGISVAGLVYLAVFVNALTTCLVALSLVTYVAVYTPLKRVTWHNTVIGAVPGALPILAGWTAADGPFDVRGLALFAILFLWQMPHFFALAWMYRKDYRDAGFHMITDDDPLGVRTSRYMVGYGIALLVVSLIPSEVGLVGAGYAAAAALLGSAFLAFMLVLAASPSDARAVRVFLGSIMYLPLLLLVMVADKLLA